jgi:adenosylcobinamide kinase/adenosylcobinamide-phosphate guanylyltransferase
MRQRIAQHQRERPDGWRTLESATGVGREISRELGDAELVIVDCITMLVNNVIMRHVDAVGEPTDAGLAEREVVREVEELLECLERADVYFIVVTNEVGLGIVPANSVSRLYRDLLGKANQMLAGAADEVIMMVSGLPVKIKPPANAGS